MVFDISKKIAKIFKYSQKNNYQNKAKIVNQI